jgi:hypothetical protein
VIRGRTSYSPRVRRALRGPEQAPSCIPRRRHAPAATGTAPAGEPQGPAPEGTLSEWHNMTPGQQMAEWSQLRAWVTWLIDRYELVIEDRLPACWAQHPGLVEELRALRAWRTEIYDGSQPQAGQAARYWHAELERVLHAAATRYAAGCRAGHRGAPHLISADDGLQRRWAQANMLAGIPPADIAAGRALRDGGLASPAEIAAAFDVGDATPLAGLRDYVSYGGACWRPAASGWIQAGESDR